MRTGNYSTIDCPTERQAEALDFLRREFRRIGGFVFKMINPHDLGSYPSFEIDYPDELKDVDENDDIKLVDAKNEWHNQAERIRKKYVNIFNDCL
jgi:hypothetical protein